MKLFAGIISFVKKKNKQRKCKHENIIPAGYYPPIYNMYCDDCGKFWTIKE